MSRFMSRVIFDPSQLSGDDISEINRLKNYLEQAMKIEQFEETEKRSMTEDELEQHGINIREVKFTNRNQLVRQGINHKYAHAFFNRIPEEIRSGIRYDVSICVGFYSPTKMDDYSGTVTLEDVTCLKYIKTNSEPDPINDVNLDNWTTYNIQLSKEGSLPVNVNKYTTKVYRLPIMLPGEKHTGVKETLDELLYRPDENPNIAFVGEKYRETEKEFSEKAKQKDQNAGRKTKSYKRKQNKQNRKSQKRKTRRQIKK